ncbi:MAG: hypothetical protein CL776_03430 [Chloroflexi bacterium]|nr:hypothetical protein [Chloroflexota bacterium]
MTTSPSYYSDEEILKRLNVLLADRPIDPSTNERTLLDAQALFSELATRIYDNPSKWGLSQIPEHARNDVAQDALVDLLSANSSTRITGSAAEWFVAALESRFREYWTLTKSFGTGLQNQPSYGEPEIKKVKPTAKNLFKNKEGPWQIFETEFQRDAYALRLKFEKGHSDSELEYMLDVPNHRTLVSKIERAKSRFQMFLEQTGYNREEVMSIMQRFWEEETNE